MANIELEGKCGSRKHFIPLVYKGKVWCRGTCTFAKNRYTDRSCCCPNYHKEPKHEYISKTTKVQSRITK